MITGYLGLGGNLGDPAVAMAQALRALDTRDDTAVKTVSRLFRTPPWGKLDQPWFVNACAKIETTLAPEPLLDACLDIERGLKRERNERWGPRTIDIDILTLGALSHASDRLTIPHPRLTSRAFVLAPLCDLAPDLSIEGRSVRDWLITCPEEDGLAPISQERDWWRTI